MRLGFYVFAVLIASTALAENSPPDLTVAEIDGAVYAGGAVPEGRSALTVKLQVLLDRAGISPRVIDGYKGGMSESAIRGFEKREGLEVDGFLDANIWTSLNRQELTPVLQSYVISDADVAGLSDSIPQHIADKAKMEQLGYTRASECLAERFHMDEDFLKALNPNTTFEVSDEITVANPGKRREGEAARIEIHQQDRRAVVFEAKGNIIVDGPVSICSTQTPSPSGKMEVTAIAIDPNYTYQPGVHFVVDGVDEALILPPGPNGPVGIVWIDLSKPIYGLHGTDKPALLCEADSHGCAHFTNSDSVELAHMVSQGVEVGVVE